MDKKIYVLIVASIIGVAALYYILNFYQNKKVDIADLKNYMGESVKVEGTLKTMFISQGGTAFLLLSDVSGDIEVVVFKSSKINVRDLERGSEIAVIGKVQEYKGELEIIAKEISEV
jgi:aspartyl/asparaginyl-tRNA synthetase